MVKLEKFRNFMIYFICFAIIGWIYELIVFLVEDHILVNRGFLYGPWLPVYGFGGIVIYFLFYRLKNKPVKIGKINIRPLLLVLYISAIAVLVELATTYICDLIKTDWTTLWYYGDKFMNFQGRIALVPGLKFGLVGIIGIYAIIPLIDKFISLKNKPAYIISYATIIIFFIDVIIHIFTGSTYNGPV